MPEITQVPMTALGEEYLSIKSEVDEAIQQVLASGRYVLEQELERFESEFADFIGVKHAIGVGSGSDALMIALRACGVEASDEVITAPNTDNPTASAIVHSGARTVLADVEPASFNLDPSAVEQSITPRTRVVLPVHLFGHPADMDAICHIAERKDLIVIEDAALAVGARYKDRHAGSFGLVGCFSLAPSKILGGFGDGGIIVTDDDEIAERCRILRNYGHAPGMVLDPSNLLGGGGWQVLEHGFNSRLDSVQAAALRVKLTLLDQRIGARRAAASRYTDLLADLPVTTPSVSEGSDHTFFAYNILVDPGIRDEVRHALAASGVASRLYYNPPLHLQPAFEGLGYRLGSFPVAEDLAARSIALPIHPMITEEELRFVADAVKRAIDDQVR